MLAISQQPIVNNTNNEIMETDSPVASLDEMSMFRPPVVRSASAILDRSLFSKTVPISAARISSSKSISRYRGLLQKSNELLQLDRTTNISQDPDPQLAAKGGKCMLLKPNVKHEDPTTWSAVLHEAVKAQEVGVIPYNLTLDYNYWTYHDIMTSILPDDAQKEIPVGFAIVGHIAHLNLREEYLPFKSVIAEVLVDKNPNITTVINKVDDVGTSSEFRTFGYEVLAGLDDMNVELSEGDCTFRFDYSKVYWNSRLQTEHKRLVDSFNPGEVVCDLMAGVGPFAIPAGKRGVFVWANDLNPDSFASMQDAVKINKPFRGGAAMASATTIVKISNVHNFVHPFCEDGRTFVHHAAAELLELTATSKNTVVIPAKNPRHASTSKPAKPPTVLTIPQTINHFVMNLPATAIEFLSCFNGLYNGRENLFEPNTGVKLPMVHVHCFSTKSDDNVKEGIEICERISRELGTLIRPGDEDVVIFEVRDVAPKKRMFCASFRLPREVAFGDRRNP